MLSAHHRIFIVDKTQQCHGHRMVFTWNAMDTPTWSDIQVSRAPLGVFHASITIQLAYHIPHNQLAYHITHNGPALLPSTHWYGEETHLK